VPVDGRGARMSWRTYSRMIKLSHTVFALPFAFAAAVLVSRHQPIEGLDLVWILVCMVTARSSAMGFNRIIDRDIDASNPRTSDREIPTGQLSVRAAWGFVIGSAVLFVAASAALGPLVLALSPVALFVVGFYSWSKRFTMLCHLVLGLALALAPTGVWIALTGSYGWTPALLSLGVGSWVAGFDIIYACQDAEFDRDSGLRSIPQTFGLGGALRISALLHLVTVAALVGVGGVEGLGVIYAVGVACITAVLVYEHAIVSPNDLSRVNKAFFELNGYVSLIFFAFVAGEVWWR
jgi:4-hydroxybenzoate polyprenyltransferase